jgi:xylulokinase
MRVTLGVDVGTSAARAVAVDQDGRVVAARSSAYPLLTPRPRWTEQDPEAWWRAACEVLSATSSAAMADGGEVVGIGLTGQMHGSVFLDRVGDVVRPALLWNDQRTASQCREIMRRIGAERLVEITGNPALTGFQAPKVLWLRDEERANFDRVAHVCLPKDFAGYRLTGEFATDASDASGTLFLDLRKRTWSLEVLTALELSYDLLPPVLESPDVAATISLSVAAELGLPSGIPIAVGGGDNAVAAIGTAITKPGLLSSSIGTSGVLFAHADDPVIDPSGRVHAFAHAVPNRYCMLAVTLSAGGSLRWWRDQTGASFHELVAEAEQVPAGSEGLVFLPYLTGERTPHLDPEASAGFIGLTARHTRAHMTRALMEGVVFSLRDGLELMRALGIHASEIRALGGGASSPLWLDLQADIYRVPIHRLVAEEGAAYGAALLGHVAARTFADVEEAAAIVRIDDAVTLPNENRAAVYDDIYEIYHSMYATLAGDMHRLALIAGRNEGVALRRSL